MEKRFSIQDQNLVSNYILYLEIRGKTERQVHIYFLFL